MFSKSIDSFFYQLYSLLKVNISLIDSLRMLSSATCHNKTVSKIAENILNTIKNGYSFSRAVFLCETVTIPTLYKDLLEAGEYTGKLSDTLEFICINTNHRDKNKKEIVNALCYPFFIFFLALFGTFLLIHWKDSFFTSISFDQIMNVVIRAVAIFCGFIFLLSFYVYECIKVPKLFQFYFSLSFLQKAGFTFTRSLELCMGNCSGINQDLLYEAYADISKGVSISESFNRLHLIDEKMSVLLKLGEDSNTVPEVCREISQSILDSYETRKDKCLRLLEPLSLLIVGVYLAVLLDGIFIPYITNFGGIL